MSDCCCCSDPWRWEPVDIPPASILAGPVITIIREDIEEEAKKLPRIDVSAMARCLVERMWGIE